MCDTPFTIDDGPVPPLPQLGVVDNTPYDITSDPAFWMGTDEEDGLDEDLSDPELPDDNPFAQRALGCRALGAER